MDAGRQFAVGRNRPFSERMLREHLDESHGAALPDGGRTDPDKGTGCGTG